jgi:hypothetical protein
MKHSGGGRGVALYRFLCNVGAKFQNTAQKLQSFRMDS